MARFFAVILSFAVLLACGGAAADQGDPRLDPLFARLKDAADVATARAIEQQIWSIWTASDDASLQSIMDAGITAMEDSRFTTALSIFSRLINEDPEWAEAWNKRATARYLLGDYEGSVRDIQATVKREPRHFGAFSGLGLIYLRENQFEAALRAFRKTQEIYPLAPGSHVHIEALENIIENDKRI